MPLLDALSEFSVDQAITADAVSTNKLELGVNAGNNKRLSIFCRVTESFNNLTSMAISLRGASTAAGVAAGDVYWTGPAILAAALVAGATIDLPPIPSAHAKFVGLYYDVTGTAPTTGKITASIVLDNNDNWGN